MPTNVYFNPAIQNEQRLYEDMIEESLRIYGQDVYYIPRSIKNIDKVLNDATANEFNEAYLIEMYIDESGYTGEGTIMSKFGLEIRDQATLVVSRRRWENFIGRENTMTVAGRPNEGDLIYIPLSGTFMEIKFVEHEAAFYQLSNVFVYELHCETFEYSGEKFNTGYEDLDSIEDNNAYNQRLVLSDGNGNLPKINEEVQQFVGYDDSQQPIFVYGYVASMDVTSNTAGEMFVNQIRSSDNKARLFQVSGIGTSGQERRIIGLTTNCSYIIQTIGSSLEITNDSNAQNLAFETEADTILDFSETNPFGEPTETYANRSLIDFEAQRISFDNTILRFDETTAKWDAN